MSFRIIATCKLGKLNYVAGAETPKKYALTAMEQDSRRPGS
jgi:hypothetical protein